MNRTHLIVFACLVTLGATASFAIAPCCNDGVVTRVNPKAGTVVVKIATNEQVDLVVDAAEPVGVRAGAKVTVDFKRGKLIVGKQALPLREFDLPEMTVAQALGKGEYEVRTGRNGIVAVRNLSTGERKSYARPPSSGLESGSRRVKVTKGTDGGVGPGSCPAGYEERCTIVSTGSSPGPEDDVISCHCIRK